MTARLPITYHKLGDTWDRTQKYTLPAGTWTATSTARKADGTAVQTFTCGLATLSGDVDGHTHALNTTASATATAAWPAETLVCDVVFTDSSATPVKRSASAFQIVVGNFLPPVLDEYTNLSAIPGDLVALLRGEQGPAGATGQTGATGATGAKGDTGEGVPVGGTTGQVLAKVSNTDHDTAWVDPSGGGGAGATNLAYTASPTGGTITSDTGTDATIPLADVTNAGLMTPAEKAKLAATSGTNTGDQDLSGYQPLAAVLTNTTASFTTAQETKLGHITVTQAVDLDAIESRVNDLDAAVVLKGVWDASAGAFPGAGAAQAGWSYIVSVAGTVDGTAFAIGDRAIAIADNASTTTLAGNWFKADYTDQVLSVHGRTGAVVAQSGDYNSDQVTEGSTNLYHTAARVRATVLTGLSTAAGTVVTATHTVLEALGFLQKQVSDNASALSGKAATGSVGSSGLTMSTARLLGRSTAATGAIEEITVGSGLTLSGGSLTASGGSPAGSDKYVQFNDGGAAGGDAGLTFDKTTKAMAVGGATVTTSNPVLNLTQTLNGAGVAFTVIKANVTDTASASGSLLADLQVGGVTRFSVSKTHGKMRLSSGVGEDLYISPKGSTNTAEFSGAGHYKFDSHINLSANKCIFLGGGDVAFGFSSSTTVAEINNYTPGTYRDLKLRNLIASGGVVTHASFTVATLPSASTSGAGSQAFVTDANATTARSTVAGGGSNKVNVFSDGTNWLIAA